MEFREVLRQRRMIRSYDPRPIPRAVLDRVLDAGRRAPSAGFSQGTSFLVLEGSDLTSTFWKLTAQREPPTPGGRHARLRIAPVIILPLSDRSAYFERYSQPDKAGRGLDVESGWPLPYWDIDTAFAVMAMLLAATDEGLGALFLGIFHGAAELHDAFGLPEAVTPIGALTLGYPGPGDEPSPSLARGRRPAHDVIHWGRWRGPPRSGVG